MARNIKVNSKCVICKKKFKTSYYIAKQGLLEGIRIVNCSYCSDECEDKFNALLNGGLR